MTTTVRITLSPGHVGDGEELGQFSEQHIVVDSHVQHLRDDEPLGASALCLIPANSSSLWVRTSRLVVRKMGTFSLSSRGMAALRKMVLDQAH